MNKEFKEKWITALRSGNYKQGTDQLHKSKNNQYCCLGVLCDLVDPKGWEDEGFFYKNYESFTSLPKDLEDELKIESSQQTNLINMNDSGSSFEEIAQYIQDNL